MFSILNRALSWAITSFGNKFCLKKRSGLIKTLNNRFYVKFTQLEIGLFSAALSFGNRQKVSENRPSVIVIRFYRNTKLHTDLLVQYAC